MATKSPVTSRPLSPHLGIYRWAPPMAASIIHRATGVGMALVGVPLLLWWLLAAAAGGASYAGFVDVFTYADGGLNVIGWVFGVGLSLAFVQHMSSGIRHLLMDTGAAFELKLNKTLALLTFVVSTTLTVAFWLYIVAGK